MSRLNKPLWALCCILIHCELSFAQINAQFTANQQQGCSPFVVNFINQSTGSINNYFWRFGNGNTSDTITPSAAFIAPGTYTVTLIVYGSGGQVDSVVKPNFITVFANPVPSFNASSTTACAPATIQFSDMSVQGSATITTWQWDFGDGGTSSLQNPSHTYQGIGSYTVSLRVFDANGCSRFIFKNDYIRISNPADASFTGTNLTGCAPPHTVNFTNTSTGIGPFTYLWDFGDGSTSTDENPTHTYNSTGSFDVKLELTVQSGGCSDVLTRNGYVAVDQPVASMSVNTNYGCTSPATSFQFTNQSTGPQTIVRWEFGDGSVSLAPNPPHVYNSSGVYTVSLVVGNGVCNDTVTDVVYVQQLAAEFSMDKDLACRSPLVINFADSSANAVSWQWDFGDGNTSTQQEPSHTYVNEGTYDIQLTITDSLNCTSTFQLTAVLDSPKVSIVASATNKCIPVNVPFVANVASADSVQNYLWDFGNGDTSSLPVLVYTYTDTGEFQIILTITTSLGCSTSDTITLEIGDKPTVLDANVIEDSTCRKIPAHLNITSDFAEHFTGMMPGDAEVVGISDSIASGSNSPGEFYTPIKIKGTFHGCEGNEFTFNDTLFLMGPFCDEITPDIDCDSPYVVNFSHNGIAYQIAHWDFGDGNTSNDNYPVHTYASRGTYPILLELLDTISGCTFETDGTVTITDVIASASVSDTVGCGPLAVTADGSASQDASIYLWQSDYAPLNFQLDPGPHSLSIPPGDYYATLIVVDVNLCADTATKAIKVFGHSNQITPSSAAECVPATLNVTGQASADTIVDSYTWTIDGKTFTDTIASYQFMNAGTYNVSLTTTDLNSCSATSVIQFIAADPQANFSPSRQLACIGNSIMFSNSSTPFTGLTYIWDFGDTTTSTLKQPSHQYGYNDTFTVSLIVEDAYNCTDTLVMPDLIKILSPTANFTVSDTAAPCPPLFVTFTDSSTSDVTTWFWSFGDNSVSMLQNPGHSYNRPGHFDVRLTVTNFIGCQDQLFIPDLIHVGGPTGDFVINPPEGCQPLTSLFNIINANDVAQITWDFGDGFTTDGDSASHTYVNPGVYYPNVVLLNDNNCSFSYQNIDTIIVDELTAAFTPSVSAGCLPLAVTAVENSLGNVTDWTWAVGIDTYSGRSLPQQIFTAAGNHSIKLIVENSRGCLDSITETITVHPLPVVAISGDTLLCQNDPEQLSATPDSNYSYQWVPATGLDDPTSSSPTATLDAAITYRVVVTDENGCIDTSDAHTVRVHPELEAFAEPDTTIIMGDTAQLRSSLSQPVSSYEWSPAATLTCSNCPNPGAFPVDRTTYSLIVRDSVGCDEKTVTIEINVIDDIKISMPDAFTPNGDDANDVIYVMGWNIKELIYFRIYNRWGELIFETEDLQTGWDGTYKGEPQNMDSYAYVVKGISFKNREGSVRGSFSLIR